MLLSPGKFFERNKHHWTVEKSVHVQICLVGLELSQDVYGIRRFLWNNTVVFWIFMLQYRLVLSLLMKKAFPATICILKEHSKGFQVIYILLSRVKWLQYSFSCCQQVTKCTVPIKDSIKLVCSPFSSILWSKTMFLEVCKIRKKIPRTQKMKFESGKTKPNRTSDISYSATVYSHLSSGCIWSPLWYLPCLWTACSMQHMNTVERLFREFTLQ